MHVTGKQIVVTASIVFVIGIVVGYKLKGIRVRYLKKVKTFYNNKAAKVQKKIEEESGTDYYDDVSI